MNPIKLYFSFFKFDETWENLIFRDMATFREVWESQLAKKEWVLSVIHVGYERPDYDGVSLREAVSVSNLDKPVLLTESAKWSLPSIYCHSTEGAISSCSLFNREQRCPLYLSIQEWGYETDFIVSAPDLSNGKKSDRAYLEEDATGWIAEFLKNNKEVALHLLGIGISTEEEYVRFRDSLDREFRIFADNFRFEFLLKFCNKANPLEILKIAPQWLLDCSPSQIDFSVRVLNVFRREKIEKIKDVNRYKITDLLRMQNFGRKSIVCLTQSLLDAFEAYKNNPGILDAGFGKKDSDYINYDIESITLHDHFLRTLADLPDNAREILVGRFGFDGNSPLTLQQLADIFGITRERIRQIEKKYLERLIDKELWDDFMCHRIERLLEDRKEPLFLDFLTLEDSWFEGFSGKTECLEEIISRFSEGRISVISFENRKIISKTDQRTFDRIVKDIKITLEEAKDSGISKVAVEDTIRTKLLGYNLEYLYDIVWDGIAENLHFSKINGIETLSGMGRSVDNLVRIVIEESDTPLHYSEIHRRILSIAERDVDIRRVHSALNSNNYSYLFDRGTYGTIRHLRFPEETRRLIMQRAEEIISVGSVHKQWHTNEILQIMDEEYTDIPEDITTYELSIILSESDDLISLGRHVWVLKYQEGLNTGDRIQVIDAFITILERAGCPLSTQDLKDRVAEYRGVSAKMQINPNEAMIRISPDHWGLINRDIPLNKEGVADSLDILHESLTRMQKSFHISELKDALTEAGFSYPENLNPYAFLGLCGNDTRFKVWHGHLIGLSTWDSARRYTVSGALRKAYDNESSSFTLDDIHERIEEMLGRSLSKSKLTGMLYTIGASYIREQNRWIKTDAHKVLEQNNEQEEVYAVSRAQGG